ncbi:uncharacterized protein LTHEOB_12965 [Lasiodiplodia theobromae]|uniref:Uncharacterized protein n=1 Tax=Lasiodiplodia theobromae TaxID=45133 RepID=A0A5N5D1M2_9PEZI|nr:uncharacterized protein LTHEOB_12965 [Lasiodiplodia theobromae]KAB2571536.1 hypothetical protein DBV05_g9829 [Lasiodiplodia theobromae]KAF4534599.1 hypothetical protein LTHEOB_12965 [Lasiodiplodia theobromae]
MSHVPTTAIRKSQVNMALQDVAESLNLNGLLRQEAEAIHDHFSQTVLANSLVHWSPDEPSVMVLLPISGRSFPIGNPATSPPTTSEEQQPSFFLLRFDLDLTAADDNSAQTISLNQHALNPHATPATSRISALHIPTNTHLNASDLWSLSDHHARHDQGLRYNLAVQTTISPSPADTTALSITVDVVAAAQQQSIDKSSFCARSWLLPYLLPRRVCPSRQTRSPLLLLNADPAQRVVQVDAVLAGGHGERFGGGWIEEVRLMERRAVWDDGEGWRGPPAVDVAGLLALEEGTGRRCGEVGREGLEGVLFDAVLVLVVFGFVVMGRWMRKKGWNEAAGQRMSCMLDEKRIRGGDEERGLHRDEKSGQM